MSLSKPLYKVVGAVLVILVSATAVRAIDLGYQSTRSMRGVAIPRLTLDVDTMLVNVPAAMAAKVRFSDGQNWITIQLGNFGAVPFGQGAELRILSKRLGYATTTRTLGRTQRSSHVRLRKVVQTSTGVTLTLYWQPAGQAYQEMTRHIAIPWAGTTHMLVALSVPSWDVFATPDPENVFTLWSWEADTQVDATAEWLTRVGWQMIPGSDQPLYREDDEFFHFSCNSTGTVCTLYSDER